MNIMDNDQQIRLEIFKTLAPLASRYSMESEDLLEKCKEVEKFVKGRAKRANKPNQSQ